MIDIQLCVMSSPAEWSGIPVSFVTCGAGVQNLIKCTCEKIIDSSILIRKEISNDVIDLNLASCGSYFNLVSTRFN